MPVPRDPAHTRLDALVRACRDRVMGATARWCGDAELAADAFSDAVLRALERWPEHGPPDDPEAWLVTATRNRIRDILGSAAVTRRATLEGVDHTTGRDISDTQPSSADPADPTAQITGLGLAGIDPTIPLLFACADPTIEPAVRAPLMLQGVLDVPTADIARAFGMPTDTMGKRITRARRRMRQADISIDVPDRLDSGRLSAVLEAIYALSAIELGAPLPDDAADLRVDAAIHLSQLLLSAFPQHGEVRGLAALLLYLRSRTQARIADGLLVPVTQQRIDRWDHGLIDRAERILRGAADPATAGRFQIEAAIQSAHAARRRGPVDWTSIAMLYEALARIAPTRGVQVARAVAIGRVAGPGPGLLVLDAIAGDCSAFQPWHAARAHLLATANRVDEARDAYRRAIALSSSPPERAWLMAACDELPA